MFLYDLILRKNRPKSRSLMLHGIGLITGDPTVWISYPFVLHPSVKISVSEPGKSKWVYMMLPLCKGDVIKNVKIAGLSSSSAKSIISTVRIISQNEPISATVMHDEAISHTSCGAKIIVCRCNVTVENSAMLKLCLDFESTNSVLEIGAIEVGYIPADEMRKGKEDVNMDWQVRSNGHLKSKKQKGGILRRLFS